MIKRAPSPGLTVCILSVTIIFACAHENEATKREKRSAPLVYNVFALDHFIELVEKIERNVSSLYDVASHIRHLGYNDDYWTNLLGLVRELPVGILSTKEKDVLQKMVAHSYVGSRELGVIRTSSGETIAIGYVINGICAGYVRNTRTSLVRWSSGATRTIDNLYGATLSRNLARTALAKKNNPSLPHFGPSGSWDSSTCPETYTLSGASTEASNAELLGDIDGFILGYYLPRWVRRGVRLGQLFRMYYSTGICYDTSVASCKRYNKLKSIANVDSLQEEVSGLAEAIYLKNTGNYPNVKKEDIPGASRSATDEFFPYVEKLNGLQTCPEKPEGCELSANLVILMDESGSIKPNHYATEKLFVRQITDAFSISPRQTKVAIVEFSTNPDLAINLHDYGSNSRLNCAIRNLVQKGGYTHMDRALRLVKDQIFLPAQRESSSRQRDVSNIAILLTDGKATDKAAFQQAVQEIKAEVKDLTMISVGVGDYVYGELELIATDPKKHVFTASNFDHLLNLVKGLQNRTCTTPSQMDMDFKQEANDTVITAYVSPGNVRYFALAPRYFFGVSDIYIQIQPLFGSVSTYASRTTDTPGPGNYVTKIDPIPLGQTMSLHISNPCSGFNITTCPPVYLAIRANDANCACTEQECTAPSQIKFTIKNGRSSAVQIRGSIFVVVISLALSQFNFWYF